jgi:hypothetical protein
VKRDERKSVLRCAVYARVSTDSGLEQDFNSIDNQREASEAYIKSQAHEGWKLVRERYEDGGFSGGSMERPALQKLLDDVRARRTDVIVVYKVDRLTRSLADFAKLVERDCHENLALAKGKSERLGLNSSRGRCPPILEGFAPKGSERVAGNKMALDVESVLHGGVNGQESLR